MNSRSYTCGDNKQQHPSETEKFCGITADSTWSSSVCRENLLHSVRQSLTEIDEENKSRGCCFLSKKIPFYQSAGRP